MPEQTEQTEQTEQAVSETFQVVVNHEEQYSLWWLDRELPSGWEAEGTTGSRQECLDRIAAVWTDMRPLSLRRRTAAAG